MLLITDLLTSFKKILKIVAYISGVLYSHYTWHIDGKPTLVDPSGQSKELLSHSINLTVTSG